MKTKHYLMIAATVFMSLCILTSTSWAGSARQHRLEGVAVAIGAMILTKALIDHSQEMRVYSARTVAYRDHHRPAPQPAGYWEIHKEWVPAKYQKIWYGGQKRRGHWKRIEIEPGHWEKKRVWVAYQ
jgi:hypothetical protein